MRGNVESINERKMVGLWLSMVTGGLTNCTPVGHFGVPKSLIFKMRPSDDLSCENEFCFH